MPSSETPLPRYRCHKRVWALKIKAIEIPIDPTQKPKIIPEDAGYSAVEVETSYIAKHSPSVGGYYVVYEDGYVSFSPAKAFEEGYTRALGMSFGEALEELKRGKKVARWNWNGRGMWLALQVPDEHSKMSLPYIYMSTVDGKLVPWLASQTDMLSDDWLHVLD